MHDDEFTHIPDDLSGSRQKFCVEGEELIWVRVGPHRQSIDTTNDLERADERADDICTVKSVRFPRDLRQSWAGARSQCVEYGQLVFFHIAQQYNLVFNLPQLVNFAARFARVACGGIPLRGGVTWVTL